MNKKPAPDIFLIATARLGIKPEACVVEDAVHGAQAAASSGMRCVAVATTFGSDQLSEADGVRNQIGASSLADVAPFL